MSTKREAALRARALAAFKAYAPEEDADLAEAKAPNTIIQIGSRWRVFVRWCEEQGFERMPATAKMLRGYVKHLAAERRSPTTIDAYIAAISVVHAHHGHRIDRTMIVEHLKAARRRAGPVRRARPLIGRELKAVIDRLNPEVARDARDGAMMLLGYAAALRSAELVGLDWQRAGGRAYGGTGFVSAEPEGLEVTLLTSKASQLTPVQLAIPDREMPTLRTWLDRWIAHAQVQPGEPLFRPITRHNAIQPNRLAGPSVADVVKARMLRHAQETGVAEAEALLLAAQFSSHSMRRGYCTTAANARVPLSQIRPRSRHRSDEVLGAYIASAEQGWNHSGLEGVGF